jgi:hypothetical protein
VHLYKGLEGMSILRNDVDGLRSTESEMSNNFLSLRLDGLQVRSASNTEPDLCNFSMSTNCIAMRYRCLWLFFSKLLLH